jgi:hypothetical protein
LKSKTIYFRVFNGKNNRTNDYALTPSETC